MAETTLVDTDIEASRALVKFLESHGFPLKAAMWLYHSDSDRWRFVVCPTEQRSDPTSFYKTFVKLIDDHGAAATVLGMDRVDIVDAGSALVNTLGKFIRVASGNPLRLTNNKFDEVFLEDALILKLAA
jgi:hypothetical protein